MSHIEIQNFCNVCCLHNFMKILQLFYEDVVESLQNCYSVNLG